MNMLFDHLLKTRIGQRLITTLTKHDHLTLDDAAPDITLAIIELLRRQINRPVLVVHHNLFHAQKMHERLSEINRKTLFYPQDEFITTDMLAMSEALKFERLDTIRHILKGEAQLVVTHTTGLIKNLVPLDAYRKAGRTYRIGDDLDVDAFLEHLIRLGYQRTTAVGTVGDFSVRGGLIDVYLTDFDQPIRIDLFDTEIETIRTFNVNTQRSTGALKAFTISPRTEFFPDQDEVDTILANVGRIMREGAFPAATKERVTHELAQLKDGMDLDRLARYMTFAGKPLHTLCDYLEDPLVIFVNKPAIEKSYQTIVNDLTDWILELDAYPKIGFEFIRDLDRIFYTQSVAINPLVQAHTATTHLPIRGKETSRYQNNMHPLISDLKKYDGYTTVLITLKDADRRARFIELLDDRIELKVLGQNDPLFPQRINVLTADNPLTFEWFDAQIIVLNEAALFHEPQTKKVKYRTVFKDTRKIDHVKELSKGDYLVHYEHGIGRFIGIETMHISGHTNDYVVIQYRGDDTLYIPVENIHLVQKYVTYEGVVPKLNRLSSAEWAKTKQRVRRKAKDIAADLIKLYAAREQVEGFAFSPDDTLMTVFEADFPYEETDDQLQAIDDVKRDMEAPRPMDRLICGDVGYGKTEVALRAAAKAALDNKQTAYLAPTTVLARQHYHTFKDRLEPHGIRCALLNRFVTPAVQKQTLKALKEGKVDVVLGTHRLLSKDVEYKDLGLLIIDEEQRFGVEHKEKIKTFKTKIDVLSLSATPIPRTLQMALTGVKQMSLLETPPKNRFPVQTYVLKRNDHVIKDAIERELARGGQAFYLYNRVETIENIQHHLTRLIPDARIAYAHGKMSRLQLEKVITAFLDHQFDVLVSTTIIETGIDIPNANTLVVHDADQLGLAQLYQIRGRVGRSDRVAYSYLMYAEGKSLSDEAVKRLQVIKEFTELGSGYKIAVRDLAIRGAGDLLGTEQSGFIDSVGIDLFLEILKEEIAREQDKDMPERDTHEATRQAIRFQVDKTIPISYIADDDMRLDLHRRINALTSSHHVLLLKDEMTDRFGAPPEHLVVYMLEKVYENLALTCGVEKTFAATNKIQVVFSETVSRRIDGERLFAQANDLSRAISLSYRKGKIAIIIEPAKLERHFLHVLVPLLESL
ncbi:MAG: transcription-repair coupling factor [Acholeplasmatales bacterium]|nr:MAG: transcription-repair coupling factor [Acholeplasmatales bacterium]